MELVDSHCHLDLPAFDSDRDAILARCSEIGIKSIIVPGITRAGWDNLLSLCSRHSDMLYPALGLHPWFLSKQKEAELSELAEQLQRSHPVAVGEIGLDYYLPHQNRALQLNFFETQLDIAEDAGLPVILHVRKAHDTVLGCLRRRQLKGGVAHAFNGSLQQAEQYISLGFKLGFGGAVTYPGARKLRRLAQQLPLNALLLETDAPDMAPADHHGERNRPDHLPEILHTLAHLRDENPATIATRTTANARELFALDRK
ncbi:MAG TPA: TatD family deoxyribonuclease [Gammaproteobacteria bacterium]|nr:TatD family deoxyribonuclease [Gammaproteobacteria bacterium]